MQNTYLDAQATLTRMHNMEQTADHINSILGETRAIMEQLSQDFTGVSASNLQKNYESVESTFNGLRQYFQSKIKEMDILTSNITTTDER